MPLKTPPSTSLKTPTIYIYIYIYLSLTSDFMLHHWKYTVHHIWFSVTTVRSLKTHITYGLVLHHPKHTLHHIWFNATSLKTQYITSGLVPHHSKHTVYQFTENTWYITPIQLSFINENIVHHHIQAYSNWKHCTSLSLVLVIHNWKPSVHHKMYSLISLNTHCQYIGQQHYCLPTSTMPSLPEQSETLLHLSDQC